MGVAATRARVLKAAQALLGARDAVAFTIDAVARRARVTRVTVYGHFRSRRALLEALFDELARQGGMEDLAVAFREPDPADALAGLVATFGRFWTAYRPIHRRLSGLAVLDRDLERTLRARQEWRRQGLRVIVGRARERYGQPTGKAEPEAVDVLFALTSFEMFDLVAGPDGSPATAVPLVLRTARAVLGLG